MFRPLECLNESRGSGRPPPAVSFICSRIISSISKKGFISFITSCHIRTWQLTGAITSDSVSLCTAMQQRWTCSCVFKLQHYHWWTHHRWQLEWKCNQQVHTPSEERSIQFSANNEKNWMCSDSVYNTNNSNPSLNYVYLNSFYRQLVIETPLHVCPTIFISWMKMYREVRLLTQCSQNRTSLYISKQGWKKKKTGYIIYTGIPLLSTTYKLLSNVLPPRLTT